MPRRVDLYWLACPVERLDGVRHALAQEDVEAEEIRRRSEEGGDVVTLEVWGMAWRWERRRFEQFLRSIAERHGETLTRQRVRVLHHPHGWTYAPYEYD